MAWWLVDLSYIGHTTDRHGCEARWAHCIMDSWYNTKLGHHFRFPPRLLPVIATFNEEGSLVIFSMKYSMDHPKNKQLARDDIHKKMPTHVRSQSERILSNTIIYFFHPLERQKFIKSNEMRWYYLSSLCNQSIQGTPNSKEKNC